MTLKDQNILEATEDVLVNVNIVDDERYKKNNEIKKQKPGYVPFEEEEVDEFGLPKTKSLLAKYDPEIDGEKRESFVLGNNLFVSVCGSFCLEFTDPTGEAGNEEARFKESLKEKLKEQQKRIETLESRPLRIASEYYTAEEMVSFKKPKRRVKKIRSSKEILKADDLLKDVAAESTTSDLGSRSKRPKTEPEPEFDRKWFDRYFFS